MSFQWIVGNVLTLELDLKKWCSMKTKHPLTTTTTLELRKLPCLAVCGAGRGRVGFVLLEPACGCFFFNTLMKVSQSAVRPYACECSVGFISTQSQKD